MGGIRFIKVGFMTSVQDFGRPDGGAFGIPWCGAMDRHSFQLCNQILGNPLNSPVLEITLVGPEIKIESKVNFCITGADISPKLNGKAITLNEIHKANVGDTLSFGKLIFGCRAYLGFSRSFELSLSHSSYSTYAYAKLGGIDGDFIKKDDFIPFKASNEKISYSSIPATLEISNPLIVKVLKGPEFDELSEEQIENFFNNNYTIGKDSNRMGLRLEPKEKIQDSIGQIISSGIIRGTIQLPPSGKPIILMADAPTTGGYLRILNCTEYSINQLAQSKAGDRVYFELV